MVNSAARRKLRRAERLYKLFQANRDDFQKEMSDRVTSWIVQLQYEIRDCIEVYDDEGNANPSVFRLVEEKLEGCDKIKDKRFQDEVDKARKNLTHICCVEVSRAIGLSGYRKRAVKVYG